MKDRRDEDTGTPIDPSVIDELLTAIAPVAPPATLRARVLERVRAATLIPDGAPIRSDQAWKTLMPGIEIKILMIDERAHTKSFLLRAQPGASLPGHAHSDYEECLVLDGEFTMGDTTLCAGDFLLGTPGRPHPEAHTRTGVLVYLRASLDDYPGVC